MNRHIHALNKHHFLCFITVTVNQSISCFMIFSDGKLTHRSPLMEDKRQPNSKQPVHGANESPVIIAECHQTPGGGGRWRGGGRGWLGVRFGGGVT